MCMVEQQQQQRKELEFHSRKKKVSNKSEVIEMGK